MEVRHYGDWYIGGELADRTSLHGSGTIDVQVRPDGTVAAVWFRCLSLPFTVSAVSGDRALTSPDITVTAVEYLE